MVIKAEVTPEEKSRILELAAGRSISSYIREKALCWTDTDPAPIMRYAETLAGISQRINEIATTVIRNKVIYEEEILELLDRMASVESATANALKEASKNGHSG